MIKNKKIKDYYVYLHKRKSDGKVFYVGKGTGNRAYQHSTRSRHHRRVAKKYGTIVQIYAKGLQEWYAYELEQELIAYYGRKDLGYGILVNYTDGGNGVAFNLSEETRTKLSTAVKSRYQNDPELKAKNSARMVTYRTDPKWIKSNREFLNRIKRKVIMDEEICFTSMHEAALYLGHKSLSTSIKFVCELKDGYKFCKGHIFRYIDEPKEEYYTRRDIQFKLKRDIKVANRKKYVKTFLVDKEHVFLGMKAVSEFVGASARSIYIAMQRSKLCKGHLVEHYKGDQMDLDTTTSNLEN